MSVREDTIISVLISVKIQKALSIVLVEKAGILVEMDSTVLVCHTFAWRLL